MNLLRLHVGHAVFQLGEGRPERGRDTAVTRQHLPHFLQRRHFGEELNKAALGRGVGRQCRLFHDPVGQAPGREAGKHEGYGIPDERTPLARRLRDQHVDRHHAAGPISGLPPELFPRRPIQGLLKPLEAFGGRRSGSREQRRHGKHISPLSGRSAGGAFRRSAVYGDAWVRPPWGALPFPPASASTAPVPLPPRRTRE